MGRRRQSIFEVLMDWAAMLPWWVGAVLALISYLVLHSFATQAVVPAVGPGVAGAMVVSQVVRMVASVLQYLVPICLVIGAVISVLGRVKRGNLLMSAAGKDGAQVIDGITWQDFELLVGEAYRHRGYQVQEIGGGGADGGVDLVLNRDSEKLLVQCKHWKAFRVDVKVVRELYGIMTAEHAQGGVVVTLGVFTEPAQAFAMGKNLKLIDGEALADLLQSAQDYTTGRTSRRTKTGMSTEALGITVGAVVIGFGLLLYNYTHTNVPAAPLPQPVVIAPRQLTPQQEMLERSRKQDAADDIFAKQYKEPAGCDNWQSDKQMVECVNQRMRAKAAFLAVHPELQ